MKLLRFIQFWLSFWIFTAVFFIKLIAVYFWARFFRPETASNYVHLIACQWGKAIFQASPWWTYTLEGLENFPKGENKAAVMVANHQSAVDIAVLLATKLQFRWLSKYEVFKAPLIGQAMKWAGYVPIIRGNRSSHKQALQECHNWLNKGVSVVFFPEGTRSETGKIKGFKSGAFLLAEKANVPIVPVAIKNSRDLLAKNSLFPNKSHVSISIMPATTQGEEETLDQFIERVRQQIRAEVEPTLNNP